MKSLPYSLIGLLLSLHFIIISSCSLSIEDTEPTVLDTPTAPKAAFTPTCYFHLEEGNADVDYFPDLLHSDSTAFEIEKWKAKDIHLLLQKWKAFQTQHSCSTKQPKQHPNFHSLLKSPSYTSEIHYIYYDEEHLLTNFIIYWDKGFAILEYGWQPSQ